MLSITRRALLTATLVGLAAPMALDAQMLTPFVKKDLYSDTADAKADIAAAIRQGKAEHKRILLDFGGNWCGDCQVLDIYIHQSPNSELLSRNFVLVHVNIGQYDRNVDLAKRYGIPLEKGVPALAVLDSSGRLLYSQANKEFENMRQLQPSDVTAFLNRWKAKTAAHHS